MNFEKWFKQYDFTGTGISKNQTKLSCHVAWFHCKQQIISLINQNVFYNPSSDCALVSRNEIIKKISKL